MARRRSPESVALSKRVQSAFGSLLHDARRNSGVGRVGQDKLAGALSVSRTSISNIERGQHRVFLDQVYAAAKELGVPLDALLPPLNEVFREDVITASPSAPLKKQSMRAVSEMAKSIVERAARDETALNSQTFTKSSAKV